MSHEKFNDIIDKAYEINFSYNDPIQFISKNDFDEGSIIYINKELKVISVIKGYDGVNKFLHYANSTNNIIKNRYISVYVMTVQGSTIKYLKRDEDLVKNVDDNQKHFLSRILEHLYILFTSDKLANVKFSPINNQILSIVEGEKSTKVVILENHFKKTYVTFEIKDLNLKNDKVLLNKVYMIDSFNIKDKNNTLQTFNICYNKTDNELVSLEKAVDNRHRMVTFLKFYLKLIEDGLMSENVIFRDIFDQRAFLDINNFLGIKSDFDEFLPEVDTIIESILDGSYETKLS